MRSVKTIVFTGLMALLTQFAVAQNHDAFTTSIVEPIKSAKISLSTSRELPMILCKVTLTVLATGASNLILRNSVAGLGKIFAEYEIRLKVKDLPTGYYLLALKDEGNSRSSMKFLKH